MISTSQYNQLDKNGYTIIRKLIDSNWVHVLLNEISSAFLQHKEIQKKYNNEIKTDGVALHVLLHNSIFVDFLQCLIDNGFIKSIETNFFNSNCILNSFSALNNIPNQLNFSALIHRDLRFYSGTYPMMLNCLLMLDEFTIENGGTYLLPGSHLIKNKPSDAYFFENAIQITGNPGDLLIFNSNVWHSAAPNKTNTNRRAIPFTISKSFMKQLLDYPRAIGYNRMDEFSLELQQLLGYHSRVPASLDEWYQPESNRFYKKDQD